jgi:hypothetical protein
MLPARAKARLVRAHARLHLNNMATIAIDWVTLCAYHIVAARSHARAKGVRRERTAGDVVLSRCPSKFHAADALATCVEFYARRLDFVHCFPHDTPERESFPKARFGQETFPSQALGKLLGQTCPNWCPTNINDFKHSINRPSSRRREQDPSRIARLLLAPF